MMSQSSWAHPETEGTARAEPTHADVLMGVGVIISFTAQ